MKINIPVSLIVFVALSLFIISIKISKDNNKEESIVCIDQVEYIKIQQLNNSYMVPHFKQDGTLYTCK
jgi:hypothetical protein